MKMTPAQQAAYTEAVMVESGGELSIISSSYSTADRSRCKVSSTIAKTWVATLHWKTRPVGTTLENHPDACVSGSPD